MNIFDNFIKDTEIIGIGTLNSTEQIVDFKITRVEYTFRVFTKASAITIYSPAYKTNGDTDNKDAWLKKYWQIKEKIKQQIGELDPNS